METLLAKKDLDSPEEVDMKVHFLLNALVMKSYPTKLPKFFYQTTSENLGKMESFVEVDKNLSGSSESEFRTEGRKENNTKLIVKCFKENEKAFSNDVRLAFQMSRLYIMTLNNSHKAYAKLLEADEQEPGLPMQFAIYCAKNEIYRYALRKQRMMEKSHGFAPFYKILIFEKEFENMRSLMKRSAGQRIEFWRILKSSPNLNFLHHIRSEVIALDQRISISFNKLVRIYKFLPCLKLAKKFNSKILGDKAEATSLRNLILKETMEKNLKNLNLPALFEDRTVTVLISGNRHDLGKIYGVSQSIKKSFGYEPSEVLGQPLAILMPSIYAKLHEKYMLSYFKTGRELNNGKQFTAFAMSRKGYIFPVKIAKQQICTLSYGVVYVGTIQLLYDNEEEDYILTTKTGLICGISSQVCDALKMNPRNITSKEIYIFDLCDELKEEKFDQILGNVKLSLRFGNVEGKKLERSKKSSINSLEVHANGHRPNVRCEIEEITYFDGLIVKSFFFPKGIHTSASSGKKGRNISGEVMHSIATIFRAIRKFKKLLLEKKNKKSSRQSVMMLPTKHSKAFQSRSSVSLDNIIKSVPHFQYKGNKPIQPVQELDEESLPSQTVEMKSNFYPNETTENKPSVLRKNIVNDISSIASSSSSRTEKNIREIKKKLVEKNVPLSIINIKRVSLITIALILMLVTSRLLVQIFYTGKAIEYSEVLRVLENRLASLQILGQASQLLNQSVHGQFDFTSPDSLLNYSIYNTDSTKSQTNFLEYTLNKMEKALETLKQTQNNISQFTVVIISQAFPSNTASRLSIEN